MIEKAKTKIHFLRICAAYFPHIWALQGIVTQPYLTVSIWRRKEMVTLVACSLLFGIMSNTTLINLVDAFLSVQNFANAQKVVEPGLTIYKYETESTDTLTSQADFDTGTISSGSFEVGSNDILTVAGSDDYFTLNHYGANEPNTTDNGDWWDDDVDPTTKYNWKYRQCFDIDYSSGTSNLTEYQLYLDFDTATEIAAGTMQSEGGDIRIVDPDGNLIDHYIADDINTNSTRIWIQPDLITAGSTTNYCLYYGNPTATSTSDRNSVFTYSNQEELYYILAENSNNDIISFGSYVDNNNIIVDSYNQTYDQYEINSTSGGGNVAGNSDIRARGPIQATIGGANVDSVVPISNAGTEFAYRMDRATHMFEFVSPFCAANIEIYNTTNLSATVPGGAFTINPGESYTWDESVEGTGAFDNDDAVYIASTNNCPVVAYHRTTGNSDTFPMFPATTEDWYGVGSNSLEISGYTDTNLSVYDSGASSTSDYTLNAANDYYITDNGAASQGNQPSQRVVITSGSGIGAKSLADSDGNESSTFIPRSEMDTKYIIPEDAEYVAIATIAGANTTVEVYNDASLCIFGGSPDQTATANSNNAYPGHIRFGFVPQGACLISNHPIAPYYEKNSGNDETSLWSWKQGRQRVQIEPTVSVGAVEAGTWNFGTGDDWNSRLPVTITNNVGGAIAEYPVRIPLSGQSDILSNAQADGGDVRLAGALGDGSDNQDYYLEEFNNSFAGDGDVWTQVNIGGNGTQTLYIYYNSTTPQTSTANQESVFTYTSAAPLYYPVSTNSNGTFNIYSLIDDNDLFFLGASYSDFDQGENYSDPGVTNNATGAVVQGEAFIATGPVSGTTTSGDAVDALSPISFAGTKFLTIDERDDDTYSLLAPLADSTVTIDYFDGTSWVNGSIVNLTQNVSVTTPAEFPGASLSVRITATTPILVHKQAEVSGTPFSDSLLLYPVEQTFEESTGTYEIYGINSGTGWLATENPANITFYYDDGTSTTTSTSAGSNMVTNISGGASQGQGRSTRIVSDQPIYAHSQADSDGNEAVAFLPKKEFGDEFLITMDTEYVSIISTDPNTVCTIYNDDGAIIDSNNLGAQSSPYVNFQHFGSNSNTITYDAGDYIQCTDPVYAYWEKNNTSAGNISDETTLLSFPQARKKALVEPVVTDIDDVQVLEEGLYYESGYDSDSTSLDPEATISFIFDANSFNNPDHIAWDTLDWTAIVPTESEENNVEPVAVEVLYGDSPTCSTASYTTAGTLTATSESIPLAASDNRCLQFVFTLRTGDEAYAPQINDFTLTFTDPVLMDDITNINTINIDGNISATDQNERILKFVITNPNLDNQLHELSYQNGTNTGDYTTWELDLVELDSATSINQFTFPAFPITPPAQYSGSTANINNTIENALYLNHARNSGANSSFDLESHIYLEGVSGVEISRPYTLNIGGV